MTCEDGAGAGGACPRCKSRMLVLWRVHGVGAADSGRCLNCLARLGLSDGGIAMIEEPEIPGGRRLGTDEELQTHDADA